MGVYRIVWLVVVSVLGVVIFQELNDLGYQLSHGVDESLTPIVGTTIDDFPSQMILTNDFKLPPLLLAPAHVPRPGERSSDSVGRMQEYAYGEPDLGTSVAPVQKLAPPSPQAPLPRLEQSKLSRASEHMAALKAEATTVIGAKDNTSLRELSLPLSQKPKSGAESVRELRSQKQEPQANSKSVPRFSSGIDLGIPASAIAPSTALGTKLSKVVEESKNRASTSSARNNKSHPERAAKGRSKAAAAAHEGTGNATAPQTALAAASKAKVLPPLPVGQSPQHVLKNLEMVRRRQGVILFTHIRRAGGTVLEDYVLKPFVKSSKTGGKPGTDYLCKEGELGRFYRMPASEQKKHVPALAVSSLQWRHCPFGLHALLPSVAHVYITMLRDPTDRMLSWYAYCDKYSPNKCHAGKGFASQGKPGESPASRFYSSRRRLYEQGKAGYDASVNGGGLGVIAKAGSVAGTFHPNNLEYRLDDNYQTRMLCGPSAHDGPIPIGEEERSCALSNLEEHYAFVATTERYAESICVLAALVNINPGQLKKVKNDKATTSKGAGSAKNKGGGGGGGSRVPPDFKKNWGSYVAHDEVMHAQANRRLDLALTEQPQCRGGS